MDLSQEALLLTYTQFLEASMANQNLKLKWKSSTFWTALQEVSLVFPSNYDN
jgi:hypothetical protein